MAAKMDTTIQLEDLRVLMQYAVVRKEEFLTGYLIPARDAHNSNHVAACDGRLGYISGFNGSRGMALVTLDKALLWTDSYYYHQAALQMDGNWTLMNQNSLPGQWITSELPAGSLIGIDPRLISHADFVGLGECLKAGGMELVAVDENLVDNIWLDRPALPSTPVNWLGLHVTGKSTAIKLKEIRKELKKGGADYVVISDLNQIAWLLNWQGSELPYSVAALSYCIVGKNTLDIFLDTEKRDCEDLINSLDSDGRGQFQPYNHIGSHLERLVARCSKIIWMDPTASHYLARIVPESRRLIRTTPCDLMKSIKSNGEIRVFKECLVRDGVAVCQFFAWLERTLAAGEVITEAIAVRRLDEFRKNISANYVGSSYPTMTSVGRNVPRCHYQGISQDEDQFRTLTMTDTFMIDSEAQYLEGTTDFSRTIHFGEPTALEKERYTILVKEKIQLVSTVFPKPDPERNSNVNQQAGSWQPEDLPGMTENRIMSSKLDTFQEEMGIRLENIIRVVKAAERYQFGKREYLTYVDMTLIPIQQRMINASLLSQIELLHLNAYNQHCRSKLGRWMLLNGISIRDPAYQWLMRQGEAIPYVEDGRFADIANP